MFIKEIDRISSPPLSSSQKLTQGVGFRNILDKKLSEISETNSQRAFDHRSDLIDQSAKVLDLLDEYINQLNDPVRTLKDIDPLVKTIEKEVALFETGTLDNISRDEEIEGFFNDLAVTANVALFKFKRGDFL